MGFPEGFVWWWLGWMIVGLVLLLAVWGVSELVVWGRDAWLKVFQISQQPTTIGKTTSEIPDKISVGLGERRYVGIGAADGCQEVFRGDTLGSITIAGRISDTLLRLDG